MNEIPTSGRDEPTGFRVPEGWTFVGVGTCRGCRARIAWCDTPAGKKHPVDVDGTTHLATCAIPHVAMKQAAEFSG